MTVKEDLQPLLLPLVVAERDCTNAVMKNYLDWKHIDYSKATGDVVLTRDEWNTLKDGFFFQAGVMKDQSIMMMANIHAIMRILFEAGLVDEMPLIDTCMVGPDGRPRVGGSCTGGGGGW